MQLGITNHLRRKELNTAEQTVLSVAIRILLWRIEGRSFQQIVAYRYMYIAQIDTQRELEDLLKYENITTKEYNSRMKEIVLKYSQTANSLPKSSLIQNDLFGKFINKKYIAAKLPAFDYDILVYDTYDYLDQVISLSLSNPLSAAFQIYYEKTNDPRALTMSNYIKYGTNDSKEILLMRYGFEFEDIDWLKDYVQHIDENEIIFKSQISDLTGPQIKTIERYIHNSEGSNN